jgi:hypothetical protein
MQTPFCDAAVAESTIMLQHRKVTVSTVEEAGFIVRDLSAPYCHLVIHAAQEIAAHTNYYNLKVPFSFLLYKRSSKVLKDIISFFFSFAHLN